MIGITKEKQQAHGCKRPKRAYPAVTHDFQHALPAAPGEQAIHRIHKAVIMQATSQNHGHKQPNGHIEILPGQKTGCNKNRQHVNKTQYDTDQRKATRRAAKVTNSKLLLPH